MFIMYVIILRVLFVNFFVYLSFVIVMCFCFLLLFLISQREVSSNVFSNKPIYLFCSEFYIKNVFVLMEIREKKALIEQSAEIIIE